MALEFETNNSTYIVVPDSSTLDVDSEDFSISLWLKLNTKNMTQMFVDKGEDPNQKDWRLWIDSDNRLNFDFEVNNQGEQRATSTTTLDTGVLYHIVAVYIESTKEQKIYLDGSVVATNTATYSPASSSYNLVVGGKWEDPLSEYTTFLDGDMFDVRLYKRALSEAEVNIICNSRGFDNVVSNLMARWLMDEKPDGTAASGSNSIIDLSGNGNHGTPYNSPVYRSAPVRMRRIIYIPFPIHFSRFIQDSGSGTDNIAQITSTLSVQDSGAGTDVPSIAVSSLISDTGTGLDSISTFVKQFKTISDIGSGADLISILIKQLKSVSDSGVGTDTITAILALVSILDSGAGTDAITSILNRLSLQDSGIGMDVVSILAHLAISDSGLASEAISILTKIALSDSGVGAETILGNFQKWVSDTGTGLEALSILVRILIEESGTGIDEILKRASFQYKVGKVIVVKDSSIVTGTNTFWQNKVRAGDLFKIKGENAVYVVSAVNSDTELVLSSDYVGDSKEEVDYIIHRFFTSNYLFPLLTGKSGGYSGDEDWGELYRWTMRKIDRLLKGVEG